jgi:hypothetical protein
MLGFTRFLIELTLSRKMWSEMTFFPQLVYVPGWGGCETVTSGVPEVSEAPVPTIQLHEAIYLKGDAEVPGRMQILLLSH